MSPRLSVTRAGIGSCSDLPGEAQIRAQHRHPPWVVLLVKGDLTLAVRGLRCAARGGSRSTAPVNDAGCRLEADLPPPRAYGRAQVDVLRVHEEALVEQAYGLEIAPA